MQNELISILTDFSKMLAILLIFMDLLHNMRVNFEELLKNLGRRFFLLYWRSLLWNSIYTFIFGETGVLLIENFYICYHFSFELFVSQFLCFLPLLLFVFEVLILERLTFSWATTEFFDIFGNHNFVRYLFHHHSFWSYVKYVLIIE